MVLNIFFLAHERKNDLFGDQPHCCGTEDFTRILNFFILVDLSLGEKCYYFSFEEGNLGTAQQSQELSKGLGILGVYG